MDGRFVDGIAIDRDSEIFAVDSINSVLARVYDLEINAGSFRAADTHLGVHIRTQLLRIVVIQGDHSLNGYIGVDIAPLVATDAAHARQAGALRSETDLRLLRRLLPGQTGMGHRDAVLVQL